jgi:hypothetical protein
MTKLNQKDIEREFAKLDIEGFEHWLTNYFLEEECPFPIDVIEALIGARDAITDAEDMLSDIREEYNIEYS